MNRRLWLAIAAVLAVHPADVLCGALTINPPFQDCWCELSFSPGTNMVQVYRSATHEGECDLENVAFRIAGLVEDPDLRIRVESRGLGGMTGDPFGAGAVVYDLRYAPGDTDVLNIYLDVTGPVPPQVWSIEAHQSLPETGTPVAQFESNPGVWVPETGYSTRFGSTPPDCGACPALPFVGCPFAVEAGTWSTIKLVYR